MVLFTELKQIVGFLKIEVLEVVVTYSKSMVCVPLEQGTL